MAKIQMKNKIAELDGDEMTRVLWQVIKDELLTPYIDLQTEYYDLGLKNRDDSDDKITYEAAAAIKRLGVGVKCATITSNAARVKEYNLKQLTPSPNGIIRAELDGTVFRTPIFVKNVQGTVSCWKKPIILGRHAYGDVYKNCEIKTPCAGKAELVFTGEDGTEIRKTIMDMKGPGILQGIHNLDNSIESFARCCFTYALDQKVSVWFGAKDTISKTYEKLKDDPSCAIIVTGNHETGNLKYNGETKDEINSMNMILDEGHTLKDVPYFMTFTNNKANFDQISRIIDNTDIYKICKALMSK
jgi:isocitrate dehydrogenase